MCSVNFNSVLSICPSGLKQLAEEFGVPEAQMELVSEGLKVPPEHDLRSQFQKPLFRRNISSVEDIHAGAVLTGNIFISCFSRISFKVNFIIVDEIGKETGNDRSVAKQITIFLRISMTVNFFL
jgi:hypothetical protein